jgi:hypothetical protein
MFRDLRPAYAAVAARVGDRPFRVSLNTYGDVTVAFVNTLLAPDSAAVRVIVARQAAEGVRDYFRDRRTPTRLRVTFTEVEQRGEVTIQREHDGFVWTWGQLREPELPEAATRIGAAVP